MKTRTFTKAPDNSHLVKLQKKQKMTTLVIAKHFGIGENTVHQWLTGVKPCPYWTLAATEGIRRQSRKPEHSVLVLRVYDDDTRKALRAVLAAMKIAVQTI